MIDWRDTLSVSVDALRRNKLRTVLTSLGVIIGSMSIVMIVTVALTSRNFVVSQIEAAGSNLAWAELVQAGTKGQPLNHELTVADLEAVRTSVPGLVEVSGTRELSTTVVIGGRTRAVKLIGVTQGYQTIRRLIIARGRFFDPIDMETRSKVCLVTEQLSDRLFGLENPVGRIIRVGELTFTVIGVFRERLSTFGLSEIKSQSVIIPLPLMKYYTGTDILRVLYAQANYAKDVPNIRKQMARLLQNRHPIEAQYDVHTLESILTVVKTVALSLTIVLLLLGCIALLISGIGIMNIMLVTVNERTHEIGIRKAMGAARREILNQFLLEAFLISGGGALIGILLGLTIPVAAEPFLPGNIRVESSGLSVFIAFAVSAGAGVLFGYLPANRAAQLQPIESLRCE